MLFFAPDVSQSEHTFVFIIWRSNIEMFMKTKNEMFMKTKNEMFIKTKNEMFWSFKFLIRKKVKQQTK